jgi:AcrR family transcriptional regulator
MKTRDRILLTSLHLFNTCGEPNVTTIDIACEMDISPGNLYYHFRNKDDIIFAIYTAFETDMQGVLSAAEKRQFGVMDLWVYLQLMLETIWKFRFFYRDTIAILERNETLRKRFTRVVDKKHKVYKQIFLKLKSEGLIDFNSTMLDALTTNAVIITTYWLNYQQMHQQKPLNELDADTQINAGVQNIMTILLPHMNEAH